jgi:hypothetical protein
MTVSAEFFEIHRVTTSLGVWIFGDAQSAAPAESYTPQYR